MEIPYRPLGLIKEMIETIGLDVTYVYEDLVFIEHNAFLLQMGDKGEDVGIRYNAESTPAARPEMFSRLKRASASLGLKIREKGLFQLSQDEEESFTIEFLSS